MVAWHIQTFGVNCFDLGCVPLCGWIWGRVWRWICMNLNRWICVFSRADLEGKIVRKW